MSFASEVKLELVRFEAEDKCCKVSELSAILKMAGEVILSSTGLRLEFHITNPSIAKKLLTLVKTLYKSEVELKTKRWMKLKKQNMYYVTILTHVKEILADTGLEFGGERHVPEKFREKDCCKRAVLRGAFLAGGSVNSPYTSSYHLEIYSQQETLINDIKDMMNDYYLSAKVSYRNKGYLAYIKKVDKISDFLRLVDAMNISLFYEQIRIDRDMSFQINRLNNVDVANAEKTLKSSETQFQQIEEIKSYYKSGVPPRINEVILLREAYPEGSMQELSDHSFEVLGKHISKSGINHRFRDIKQLCEEIMEKQEK